MGYMRHHAILVTSFSRDDIEQVRQMAVELARWEGCSRDYRGLVGPIIEGVVNSHYTFMIAPDGSKEGWPESKRGDELRAAFVAWLDTQRYEDGSGSLDWVEVQFGDDDEETVVVAHSDEPRRKAGPGVLTL